MNLPTIIIASVIAILFFAVIIKTVKDRKSGKCSCSCEGNCSGCNGNCSSK